VGGVGVLMAETLTQYLDAASAAAWRAAAILEEYRPRLQTREKDRFDLVTDADLASQRAIRSFLTERFPEHGFLGEEEGAGLARPGPEAPPTWIVDPIDGTTNYVHDFPLYCISIGLQMAGALVAGVVLDPVRKELFRAAQGQGAWLNERRLKVSRIATLDQALVSTGFPSNPNQHKLSLEWWRYFSGRVQSLRRTGSTALNIAYVAAGRFDAYYAFDNHVWDVAAGIVIAREAGGMVTNADGSPYDAYTADAVVTNGHVHAAMLQCLREGP
jgi:myo-inositol-1(or 4)-monophosphatase